MSVVALLGRRDLPTDGVEDYCTFLGRALSQRGVDLVQVRAAWDGTGRIRTLRDLRYRSNDWCGQWVLLQYTALAWSKRGFPTFVVQVARVLRNAGAKLVVVFHEPTHQKAAHRVRLARRICQDWAIRQLYQAAAAAIFTVPLNSVKWLPEEPDKASFIPIGPNIPVHPKLRQPSGTEQEKVVVVFGIAGPPSRAHEVDEIAAVMKRVARQLGRVRLVVMGRGALDARDDLTSLLRDVPVQLVIHGIVPAEEIAHEFEFADALLFVRGAISLQRGTAIAGIASGLPTVGYQGEGSTEPLKHAGIEWGTLGDRNSLAEALVRVLTDPARWTELHKRNLQAHRDWFSWSRISERYCDLLGQGVPCGSGRIQESSCASDERLESPEV